MHPTHVFATRVAVISGIHGNVPALRACLRDAHWRGCDLVLCVGDMVGMYGHSAEVIALIERHCAVIVAGHQERAVTQSYPTPAGDDAEAIITALHHERLRDGLGATHKNWLAHLPAQALVSTPVGRLFMSHGCPALPAESVMPAAVDHQRAAALLDAAQANVMVSSKGGKPWIVTLHDGRLVVNCGSVGIPADDGDPAVHYAVIDVGPTPQAELRRVVYNYQAWATYLLSAGVDPHKVSPLTTGRWTTALDALKKNMLTSSHDERRPSASMHDQLAYA